jgi:hypothetical protein
MLNRGRGMLDRRLLHRLVNHRCACPTVAGRTAGASALDDGAGVRRRRVTANAASGTRAALDRRAMSSRPGRTVLSADATVAGNAAVASKRGALLPEDAAVSSTAGTRVDAAPGATTGREATADAGSRSTAGCGVAAQTSTPANDRRRGLRRRVTPQPALAAQRAGAACAAADTKAGTAGSGGTALTTDAHTPERARHMRTGGTVQRCTLASDQPRLTAGAQSRITACPRAGERTDIAGTRHLAAGAETGLTSQTHLAAGSGSKGALARHSGLAS